MRNCFVSLACTLVMPQFKPFAPNVEVIGQPILSVMNALAVGHHYVSVICAQHGHTDIQADKWYPQAAWLKCYEVFHEELGAPGLFSIGKAFANDTEMPPFVNTIEIGLGMIEFAFQMNHRGDDISYQKLVSYDPESRTAILECKVPYPAEVSRGGVFTLVGKLKPKDSTTHTVKYDPSQPDRVDGLDPFTLLISW